MRYFITQIILTALLVSCLKIEKKNQNDSENPAADVQVYAQSEFILDEALVLNEDTVIKADRVYLSKNAAIFAQNYNLKIDAQIIETEQGSIIGHYNYDQTATVNQDGRNGGSIEIRSQTALGQLQLLANSEKGGTGLGGWGPSEFSTGRLSHTESCTAGSGKNSGQVGSIQFETYNSQNLVLSKKILHSAGGSIGSMAANYKEITPFNKKNPNYKARNQDCTEIPVIGKSSFGGQICTRLQNQSHFECLN